MWKILTKSERWHHWCISKLCLVGNTFWGSSNQFSAILQYYSKILVILNRQVQWFPKKKRKLDKHYEQSAAYKIVYKLNVLNAILMSLFKNSLIKSMIRSWVIESWRVREIASFVWTVHNILHKHLNRPNQWSRGMPLLLTFHQKHDVFQGNYAAIMHYVWNLDKILYG